MGNSYRLELLWSVLVTVFCVVKSQDVDVSGNCSAPYKEFTVRGRTREPLNCNQYTCAQNRIDASEEFMGEPHSLSLDWDFVNVNHRQNPRLIITWEPPRIGAGFKYLKGFSLNIIKMLGPSSFTPLCYVFDMTDNNFTSHDNQLKFQKKIVGFQRNGPEYAFLLELYTLPRWTDSVVRTETFRLPVIHYDYEPGNWSPGMWYPTDPVSSPREITVRFSLAPKEYNFTRYSVRLRIEGNTDNSVMDCEIYLQHSYECQGKMIQPPGANDTHIDHTFYDVRPGRYKIRVQPYDLYWQDTNLCQCYVQQGSDKECRRCLTTETNWITVEGIPDPPTSSPISDPGATPSVSSTVKEPLVDAVIGGHTAPTAPTNNTTIIAVPAVIGSLIGLILVAVFAWVLCKRRNSGTGFVTKFLPNQPCKPEEFPKKMVYMLFAPDHDHHVAAIGKFATYLENHCNCTVLFPPWFQEPIRTKGNLNWIISSIDAADYIIIINSEAAYHLYDGRNNNMPFKMENEGPEGDMFTPALTHIMTKSNQPNFFKKTILAYFEYTPNEYILKDINPGIQYQITKHLKELLSHIHEVESFRPDGREELVKAMENVQSKVDGQNLCEAIKKARHYQKADPNWFQKRFYRQDSAYSSAHSGESEVQDDDLQDSISMRPLSPSLYVGDNPGFEDSDSTFTYDTKYILSHGQPDMIPPSDLGTDTIVTSSVQQKLAAINTHSMDHDQLDSGYFQESIPQDSLNYHINHNYYSQPEDGQQDSGMFTDGVHRNNSVKNSVDGYQNPRVGAETRPYHVSVDMEGSIDVGHNAGSLSRFDKNYIELDDWQDDDSDGGRDV